MRFSSCDAMLLVAFAPPIVPPASAPPPASVPPVSNCASVFDRSLLLFAPPNPSASPGL